MLKPAIPFLFLLVLACGSSRDRDSSVPSTPRLCGNGQVDPGEACDGAQLAGATCESLGLSTGGLSCGSNCKTFDRSLCGPSASCGNGILDPAEVCEGSELNGQTCASQGKGTGTLGCLANCNGFQTQGCMTAMTARCGNGQAEGTEVCDGDDLGGATCQSLGFTGGTLSCSADCGSRVSTGCTGSCTPMCGARVCGPDPACGGSCGTCPAGTCNASGQCEATPGGAPQILNFSTNVSTYSGGSLVFSVIVTDPDGVDDLIGGQLKSPTGGTYGSFATQAQEGAYGLTLDYAALNQVEPLMGPPTGYPRSFIAQFFDQSGNSASAELTIQIGCANTTQSLCDGSCQDLSANDFSCGQCNRVCESVLPPDVQRDYDLDESRWCTDAQCHFRTVTENPSITNCQALCSSVGAGCATPAGSPSLVGRAYYQVEGCANSKTLVPTCGTSIVQSGCTLALLECRCAI